ncbi:hypothetical protein [Streptomyces sp. BE303]|uniref:hypothetical protein n=1 Tax=Streptomyces sp. BE303 TaxID=3002528 RepID=UPI002E75E461|nr:hypothetical protein [Streptomyces sp. BE303]MED7949661.1 hypothetical protein [Streptomyces sp. BE303]
MPRAGPGPVIDDGQGEYRDTSDRYRWGLPDPARARAAYAVSDAGVLVLATLLIISTIHR